MNLTVIWEKLAIEHINGKCSLTPIPNSKQMKLSSLDDQTQPVFPYPPAKFNENNVTTCPHEKHLGIVLHSKRNFNTHIDKKFKNVIN